jgi:hypothetical protein
MGVAEDDEEDEEEDKEDSEVMLAQKNENFGF